MRLPWAVAGIMPFQVSGQPKPGAYQATNKPPLLQKHAHGRITGPKDVCHLGRGPYSNSNLSDYSCYTKVWNEVSWNIVLWNLPATRVP